MTRTLYFAALAFALTEFSHGSPEGWKDAFYPAFRNAKKDYQQRVAQDPFSLKVPDLLSGKIPLDQTSEKGFVMSLLRALDIPESSQMQVFSTTSLQLSRISPQNPRALYFNNDIYLGWVPGGKIEILGIDPEWGAMPYMFDIPRGGARLQIERTRNTCMRCHASNDIGAIPGLLVASVVPGPGGGSLDEFKHGDVGHHIPLAKRFGGWHVTGAGGFGKHQGNLTGKFEKGEISTSPNLYGQNFPVSRYLVPSSDILPQLVHEHQAGFVNRFLGATYRVRALLKDGLPKVAPGEQDAYLDWEARALVRYMLFADEAALPEGGFSGDSAFKQAFLEKALKAKDGSSLRDFDLRDRIFKYRCSYMVHSSAFSGMPGVLKAAVAKRLRGALGDKAGDGEFAYMPKAERDAIRRILRDTVPGLPADW